MATISKRRSSVFGDLKACVANITFSSSYTTGGESLRGSQLGMGTPRIVLGTGTGGEVVVYDATNQKLKLYTADGVEATNASNQSAVTVTILAIG